MRHLREILAAFLVMVMVLALPAGTVWASEETADQSAGQAAETQQSTSDNMNFDVVFAIDGSGSMKKSDALKLRLTAGRLFTELAASDTSRAGFVQFTNVIMDSQALTDLSTDENKEAFRNRLSGLKDSVKGSWDTDISLGLTEALNMLKSGDSFGNDRHPVIILLSDGNTDLPEGPRTVEESNAELTGTLAEAAKLGVPIYSIGLNWDGKLDAAYMQNIADQTSGKFYNITSASEFNQYMTEIFGNVADGNSESLDAKYKDGRYETNFVIDNSSVLTANIVILTDKGVSDPKLTNPSGEDVPLDEEHGVIVTTDTSDENKASTYTILKIMYPAQGAWKVSVKGESDDAVQINLLTTYDISFVLSGSEGAVAGEPVTITGKLVREKENIQDADLLSGATAVCTIIDSKGSVVGEDLSMEYNEADSSFSYETTLDTSGNYYISASLNGKDGTFSKDSEQLQLAVERAKISPLTKNAKTSMWCTPIKTKATLNMSDLVECESVSELNCTAEDTGNNIVDVTYDQSTGVVHFSPLRTGSQTLKLNISDDYGQNASVDVSVKVRPSWIWFVAVLVILAVLALVVIIIRKATKPLLKDPVTVELALPPMLANLTPAPVNLIMPQKKSDIILAKLIQSDTLAQSTMGDAIAQSGLNGLLAKINLAATKGNGIQVKILPKVPGTVMVNGQTMDGKKGMTCPLAQGDKLGIQYSYDGQTVTTVYLKLGDGSTGEDGIPADNVFGGNDFGFGDDFGGSPFGGGNNGFGGGAGGFGGGNNGFGSGAGGFGSGNNGFGGSAGGFGSGNNSFGGGAGGFGSGSNGFGGSSGGFGSGNNGFGGSSGSNDGGFGGSSGNSGGGFGGDSGSGSNNGGLDGGSGNSGFDFGGGSDGGSDNGFGTF